MRCRSYTQAVPADAFQNARLHSKVWRGHDIPVAHWPVKNLGVHDTAFIRVVAVFVVIGTEQLFTGAVGC